VNSALTLSTLSTSPLEEVSEACGKTARFMQLYVCPDHEASRRLVVRAERAGYSAIFLTVDVAAYGKRRAQYYNPSSLPPHLQLVSLYYLHRKLFTDVHYSRCVFPVSFCVLLFLIAPFMLSFCIFSGADVSALVPFCPQSCSLLFHSLSIY